jgi:hypothetical protein
MTNLPMKMEHTDSFYTNLPMKMEQTECFETSAYKIPTLGNYPEENIKNKKVIYLFIVLLCTIGLTTFNLEVHRQHIFLSLSLSLSLCLSLSVYFDTVVAKVHSVSIEK